MNIPGKFQKVRRAGKLTSPYLLLLLTSLVLNSCTAADQPVKKPEVISLLGRPLYSDPGGDSLLTAIDAKLKDDADNPSILHQKGLAFEGLRRFTEAIECYSKCVSLAPESPLYLRRRGHRYINIRQFDKAVTDLEKAATLHEFKKVDNLAYTENLNWAIWYYLGLAYHLQGDFEKALPAFRNSLLYSGDNTAFLASTNWVHNLLRRLNRIEEALKIVEPINEGMGYTGNYYTNILVYKGLKDESEVFNEDTAELFVLATVGYGIANWRLVNGDEEGAYRLFRKIVESESWHANGFMAAEAELARLK